jgi:hypothetical protein
VVAEAAVVEGGPVEAPATALPATHRASLPGRTLTVQVEEGTVPGLKARETCPMGHFRFQDPIPTTWMGTTTEWDAKPSLAK